MTAVKLISYSQPPSNLEGVENIRDLVAYCARVSNPANQMNTKTSDKLLAYLIKHKHWSPFELVSICMEIETTRDIARQILRHRSFSFQEYSQRYANPVEDLNFVYKEARLQDHKNRQNSIATDDAYIRERWREEQAKVAYQARLAYQWAIDNGIAKECARVVLPEGMTISRMYMNGTLRSWIHYIELRSANGTQLEHIEVAQACAQAISEIYSPNMES